MTVSRPRMIALFAAASAGEAVWLAALFAAPYLRARGSGLAPFLYSCFAPVCHQRPDRSFFAFGYPLAVCARCFGIYLGGLAGLIIYPFARGFETLRLPGLKTFILVSAPIVLDTAANVVGLWNTGNGWRFAVGFLWGTILPFYFLTGVGELVAVKKR